MFEQDYIMRMIREMVRMLLKLLFHVDMQETENWQVEEETSQKLLEELLDMANAGRINEAENTLYDRIDGEDLQTLKTALYFYACLNEKEDDFLVRNHYSRAEIRMGIEEVLARYGLHGITDIF